MNFDDEYNFYEHLYDSINDPEFINAQQMYYLFTKTNVYSIYESFCEYLETLHTDSKDEFIHLLIDSYNDRRYSTPSRRNDTIEYLELLKEADRAFKNFLEDYVHENPELEIYREEIINMRFDYHDFHEGNKMFQDKLNCVSCLK